MNHVLIGGSGFIGSQISQALIHRGDTVTSISKLGDDRVTGVTSVAIDLYTDPCPQDVLGKADTVIILIGQTHSTFDARLERETLERIARQLQSVKARVYYASTTLVYGNTSEPADETTPVSPIGPYSVFKVHAEELLQTHIPADRLTIFRFSNVYGAPRNRGIIGLLMQKSSESPIHISLNGNGLQTRDYIFVDDLITAILHVVDKPYESGITNVATGVAYTLVDVVDNVSHAIGMPIEYTITGTPIEEPQDNQIDNTRLRTVFGVTKFTPLLDGLSRTYSRYKDH
jgi:UDP-glucose 4-epimerase